MTELRGIKRIEVFLNAKRYLGMAIQVTFRLEELTNSCYQQLDEERKRRATAMQTLTIAKQSNAQLKKKLAEEEHAQKTSKEQVSTLKKQLEEALRLRNQAEKEKAKAEKAKTEAEKEKDQAEQHGNDVGVAETENNFRAEVPVVCRAYSIRASSHSSQQEETSSTIANSSKAVQTQNPPILNQQKHPEVPEAAKNISSDKAVEGPKGGTTSQSFE
ncbi:uncharacterized protein LOC136066857 [Quercus suber]|uniref:uncharacterized protein LOC136066857 n=1 Tax=Quercus suber TaxID=58331 RepID=UPI0032E03E8B